MDSTGLASSSNATHSAGGEEPSSHCIVWDDEARLLAMQVRAGRGWSGGTKRYGSSSESAEAASSGRVPSEQTNYRGRPGQEPGWFLIQVRRVSHPKAPPDLKPCSYDVNASKCVGYMPYMWRFIPVPCRPPSSPSQRVHHQSNHHITICNSLYLLADGSQVGGHRAPGQPPRGAHPVGGPAGGGDVPTGE